MSPLTLSPVMPSGKAPPTPQSRWVGELDLEAPVTEGVVLEDAAGFSRARLLVRSGRTPLGFVDVHVVDGVVAAETITAALTASGLRRPGDASADVPGLDGAEPADVRGTPGISVILSTRDRPQFLEVALGSLLGMAYEDFEVVVVDNASATPATQQVVAAIADPRVRLVAEPRPGLARARNRGVVEARHSLLAFTDDDVVVDRYWLHGIAAGFAAAENVACVCGMVPSGELRTFAQAYFDERVTWARSCDPRVYDLADPPAEQPLFPFEVGRFGTGANFAMRREAVMSLGGFDEALGVGSPTRGGEDIDMFVRVLLAGHRLVYQPSAFVWHRHRSEPEALREQIAGYGVGLGAWIAKLLVDRRTLPMVLRRAVRALGHAGRMTRVAAVPDADEEGGGHLAVVELTSALTGPYRYAIARRAGARPTPLLPGAEGE